MEQFPPEGFIETDSAVDGVLVYMPRPDEIEDDAVKIYRCARCNGNMRFDPAQNALQCTVCNNHETACDNCNSSMTYDTEHGQLICTACGNMQLVNFQPHTGSQMADRREFREEYLDQAAEGWGVEVKEIACQSCGATVTVEPNQLTTNCSCCGSSKIVMQKQKDDAQRPSYLVPFKITDEQSHTIAAEWLEKSWLVPKAAKQFASMGEFTQLYVPFWTFDARCDGDWKCEVGHERRVRRDGKTVTEIDWRPEWGSVADMYDDVQVNGTTHIKPKHMKAVGSFDLATLTEYEGRYLVGTQALAYDTPIHDAWQKARHTMRSDLLRQAKKQPSKSRVRNFEMDMRYGDEAWRYILVPLYIATYFYNNKPYQLVLNGQDGRIVGQRPADWRKIGFTALTPALIGLILLLVGYFAAISPLLTVGGILLAISAILGLVLAIQGKGMSNE